MDNLDDFMMTRPPTANRPLLGLTILVVEDSLFACEAMRLLCLRSGARIRRADNLAHARQHLRVYRPSVVIIDLGLPDGCGADLIAELTRAVPRVEAVIGISGDPDSEQLARDAGADGFIAKPVVSLAHFQSAILRLLPPERQPTGPRVINDEIVEPDPLALRDDLAHVAEVLDTPNPDEDGGTIDYVTQFLRGVAADAADADLGAAVSALATRRLQGGIGRNERAELVKIVQARLAEPAPVL